MAIQAAQTTLNATMRHYTTMPCRSTPHLQHKSFAIVAVGVVHGSDVIFVLQHYSVSPGSVFLGWLRPLQKSVYRPFTCSEAGVNT